MFDSSEKRFSAIHLTKRSGPPVPKNLIDFASRLHFIGIFSNVASYMVPPSFFWRNKNNVDSVWVEKLSPTDSSTQII